MTRMVLRTVLVIWIANVAAQGQAGVVREWQALLSTRDGMSAAEHLPKTWQPERIRLERMKSNIDKDRTRRAANRDKLKWLPWRAVGRKRLERRTANESKAYEIANQALETLIWRRKRDSNPRTSYPVNGFQDRRFQPLTHSSVHYSI
jgi:hypothetical protein